MEPAVGFEPTTDGLQNRSSTTELSWLDYPLIYTIFLICQVKIKKIFSKNCQYFQKQVSFHYCPVKITGVN